MTIPVPPRMLEPHDVLIAYAETTVAVLGVLLAAHTAARLIVRARRKRRRRAVAERLALRRLLDSHRQHLRFAVDVARDLFPPDELEELVRQKALVDNARAMLWGADGNVEGVDEERGSGIEAGLAGLLAGIVAFLGRVVGASTGRERTRTHHR